MKEHVFVSAVVYVYNEEDYVVEGLRKLDDTLNNVFINYEIIVVNDASSDRTLEQIRQLNQTLFGNLTVISLSRRHGVERAMTAGLIKSMGDFVYEFETTRYDYSLELVPAMLNQAQLGNDIVVASPTYGLPWTSKTFYKLINKITYLQLDLRTESVRMVSRRAINAMMNLREKVRYRKALYAFTGYKKKVIEYEPLSEYKSKKAKLNRENIRSAFDVVVSFSNVGLKLSHYMSILFLLFSLFMAGYSLYNYLFNKDIVEGWTTLMILISIGFSGIFFIIGMIGEYISRILIEIQNRPHYTTSSVENFRPIRNKAYDYKREVAAGIETEGEFK